MSKKISILVILITLFLQSCSSTLIHEKPNYTLTGEAAQKEIEKFKVQSIGVFGGKFEEEGLLTSFKSDEFKTFAGDTSPKTFELLEKTRVKEYLGIALGVLWISTLFIKTKNGHISPAYWVGAGAVLGYGFYMKFQRDEVRDQFNQDFKFKFAPNVGYQFKF